MNIAFYAPMKAPTHPSPSGDRRMARLLMRALETAGHRVKLASALRSWEGDGDRSRQQRLEHVARRMSDRLIRRFRASGAPHRPDLWFTYHLYHKAPDWLGPSVTSALGIPYVVAEASYAPKQAGGLWSSGHDAAAAAISQADAVVALNQVDIDCVRPLISATARLIQIKPFLERTAAQVDKGKAKQKARLAQRYRLERGVPWLLSVAMMRSGAKLRSFRLLADAMRALSDLGWRLIIVGDGEARAQVEAAFEPLGGRVVFAGLQEPKALHEFHASSDLFVWPAINEAYGMALLEAQAAALPVVAGRSGGVAAIVRDGVSGLLVPEGDQGRFAQAIASLLCAPDRRKQMGVAAQRLVAAEHSLDTASTELGTLLDEVTRRNE